MEGDDVYLVAGATGRCGVYITKSLLEKKKKVRVLIRNPKKLVQLFTEEERDQFESVVICNLVHDNDYGEKLAQSLRGNVKYIISCLSVGFENDQTSMEGYFVTNARLIDAAKAKGDIKRFLLLSTAGLTRPYSFKSLYHGFINKYTLLNKARCEEHLRKSGLSYLIVRPTNLKESDKASQYAILQGDNAEGQITIPTVGKLAIDTLMDPWIPANSTYECISYGNQPSEPYRYTQGIYKLKPDTEKDKQAVTEKRFIKAGRVIKFGLFLIFLSCGFAFAAYKKYINVMLFLANPKLFLIRYLFNK
jgi:uncharacterized protein YbjT (DUF2867 family)